LGGGDEKETGRALRAVRVLDNALSAVKLRRQGESFRQADVLGKAGSESRHDSVRRERGVGREAGSRNAGKIRERGAGLDALFGCINCVAGGTEVSVCSVTCDVKCHTSNTLRGRLPPKSPTSLAGRCRRITLPRVIDVLTLIAIDVIGLSLGAVVVRYQITNPFAGIINRGKLKSESQATDLS